MRQDGEEGGGRCLSGIDAAIFSGGFVSGGCGSSGDARESESSDELQSVLSEGEALRAASALLLLQTQTQTDTIPRMQDVLDAADALPAVDVKL